MSSGLEADAARESTVIGALLRAFARRKELPPEFRLEGQTAVITGGNTGLGLEASRQLLKTGLSNLVIGVRSQSRGDAAANLLRDEFPNVEICVWIVDMASYKSVRQFSEQCATLPRIDIVILNAGLMMASYTTVTDTGHETIFQVNYLSNVLLAILLLPVLKAKKDVGASRPPVISIIGSDTMYQPEFWPEMKGPVFQQFDKPEGFGSFPRYGATKFLLSFFVSRLAELVNPADVLINIGNPGGTKNTSLGRDASMIFQVFFTVVQFFLMRSLESGASMYLYAVLNSDSVNHGSFFSDWTTKPYPKPWYTEEGQAFRKRLWEETMEELNFAGASAIVQGMRTM
ncbi:hypothetical protein S40293_08148 [Stachybotrys chartarum IBT 40293]|nr:hypothetical protein S40293_08148 [Stachybotrys chartarum IBT 40293]KFA71539.1 hypothetical protein S40288_06838 [Stachybotrys chartarum IBT 40288]